MFHCAMTGTAIEVDKRYQTGRVRQCLELWSRSSNVQSHPSRKLGLLWFRQANRQRRARCRFLEPTSYLLTTYYRYRYNTSAPSSRRLCSSPANICCGPSSSLSRSLFRRLASFAFVDSVRDRFPIRARNLMLLTATTEILSRP